MAEKKRDDWQFEVKSENIEKEAGPRPKKKSSKKKIKSKKVKKLEEDDEGDEGDEEIGELTLNTIKGARRIGSSVALREAALSNFSEIMPATFPSRVKAFIFDQLYIGGLFIAAKELSPYADKHFMKVLEVLQLEEKISADMYEYSLIGFVGFVGFVLFFFFYAYPTGSFRKSPGKKVFGIYIGGRVIGENASKWAIIFRETLFKPISLFSFIGIVLPFINEDRRSLHDYISGTVLLIDD
jgi:uncharacterized RDD family membrane protein YckC